MGYHFGLAGVCQDMLQPGFQGVDRLIIGFIGMFKYLIIITVFSKVQISQNHQSLSLEYFLE